MEFRGGDAATPRAFVQASAPFAVTYYSKLLICLSTKIELEHTAERGMPCATAERMAKENVREE